MKSNDNHKNSHLQDNSENSIYRVSNLAFCPLKDIVVVLDPHQGLYFRMSHPLATLLQSIPERGNQVDPGLRLTFQDSREVSAQIESLKSHKLVVTPLLETNDTSDDIPKYSSDISVWGSVTDLTQTPPPPPSFTI